MNEARLQMVTVWGRVPSLARVALISSFEEHFGAFRSCWKGDVEKQAGMDTFLWPLFPLKSSSDWRMAETKGQGQIVDFVKPVWAPPPSSTLLWVCPLVLGIKSRALHMPTKYLTLSCGPDSASLFAVC